MLCEIACLQLSIAILCTNSGGRSKISYSQPAFESSIASILKLMNSTGNFSFSFNTALDGFLNFTLELLRNVAVPVH